MAKHQGSGTADSSSRGQGKHVAKETEVDPNKSFHVPAPERVARGVGDKQTGGRDD